MSPWLIVGLMIAAGLIAIAILGWLRHRREGSFRDWLRHPERFYAEGARHEAERNAVPPPNISDRQIRSYVHQLLNPSKANQARRLLQKIGPRAVPPLLEALNDVRYRQTTSKDEYRLPYDLPLESVMEVLGRIGSLEAVPALAPLMADADEEIRKAAALALGSIAHASCIEPVSIALRSAQEHVCSYALIGVSRAVESGRASPDFLAGIFEPLRPLLNMNSASVPRAAANTLLGADRDRAVAAIVVDEVLNPGNPGLCYVLEALAEKEVHVPAARLWHLEKELAPLATEYPHESAYGQVLLLQAAARSDGIEERITAALNSPSGRIQQLAAQALAVLRGARDPLGFVRRRESEVGWAGLTRVQKQVYAAYWLECEVNNGGFSQYFFNPAGDHWPEALEGLEAMDAVVTAGLLKEAVGVFGPHGPSRDRLERQEQLSKLIDENENTLRTLDKRFYDDRDRLGVRMMRFAAEHAEDFQA